MQRNSSIPEHASDRLRLALSILREHFDDVLVAVAHKETRNIHVETSSPYAARGMLPTINKKLTETINISELSQSIREDSDGHWSMFEDDL